MARTVLARSRRLPRRMRSSAFRLRRKPRHQRALGRFHEDDLFLRGLVKRLGGEIATVGYERRAREAGESKYTLKKMLKLAAKGFSCGRLRPRESCREVKYIAEVLHSELV